MAMVFWLGAQITRPAVVVCTVGNAIVGETYTLTANGKAINYLCVTGDTPTTVAAGVLAAAALSQAAGITNHTELTVAQNGAAITTTGFNTGATITVVPSATGTGTFTTTSTVAGLSPNDLADVVNYSTGAFPANNDDLIFGRGRKAALYNLAALNAITGLKVRRETGGPVVGLPEFRSSGQAEWRPTRLVNPAASITLYTDSNDGAEALKFDCNGGTGPVQIVGTSAGQLGSETCEVVGLATTGSVRVVNGSVAVFTKESSTDVAALVEGQNSTVRVGIGGTFTSGFFIGGTTQIECNFTTLNVNGADAVATTLGTATGQPYVDGGTLNWNSGGAIVNPVIGSAGLIDFGNGIAAVAVTGIVNRNDGGKWSDPAHRVVMPYDINNIRCELNSGDVNVGTHSKITVNAGP